MLTSTSETFYCVLIHIQKKNPLIKTLLHNVNVLYLLASVFSFMFCSLNGLCQACSSFIVLRLLLVTHFPMTSKQVTLIQNSVFIVRETFTNACGRAFVFSFNIQFVFITVNSKNGYTELKKDYLPHLHSIHRRWRHNYCHYSTENNELLFVLSSQNCECNSLTKLLHLLPISLEHLRFNKQAQQKNHRHTHI